MVTGKEHLERKEYGFENILRHVFCIRNVKTICRNNNSVKSYYSLNIGYITKM